MSAAQGSGLWALSSLASDSATARSEPQFLRPCPGRSCRRRRGGTEWGRRVTGALFSGSCNPESLPGLGRKGVQRLAEAETGSEPPGPRGEPGGVAGRAGCVFVPTPAVGGETGSRARSPPPAFPSAPGAERWGAPGSPLRGAHFGRAGAEAQGRAGGERGPTAHPERRAGSPGRLSPHSTRPPSQTRTCGSAGPGDRPESSPVPTPASLGGGAPPS